MEIRRRASLFDIAAGLPSAPYPIPNHDIDRAGISRIIDGSSPDYNIKSPDIDHHGGLHRHHPRAHTHSYKGDDFRQDNDCARTDKYQNPVRHRHSYRVNYASDYDYWFYGKEPASKRTVYQG